MNQTLSTLSVLATRGASFDARDSDAAVKVFAAEVDVDHTSLFGGAPTAAQARGSDLELAWVCCPSSRAHNTPLGIPSIHESANRAIASAPAIAHHFISDAAIEGGRVWIAGGCYEWELVHEAVGWSICRLT